MMNDTVCHQATPALRLHMASVFDDSDCCTERDAQPDWEQVHFSLNGPTTRGIFSKIFSWLGREDIHVDAGATCILYGVHGVPCATYAGQYLLSARPEAIARVKDGIVAKTRELTLDLDCQEDDESPAPPVQYHLTVYAEDRPGIIGAVSAVVESGGGAITDQFCQTLPTPGGAEGRGLFRLQMSVDVQRAHATATAGRIRDQLIGHGAAEGWAVRFTESLSVARLRRALSGIAGYDSAIDMTNSPPTQ